MTKTLNNVIVNDKNPERNGFTSMTHCVSNVANTSKIKPTEK